MRFSDRGRCWVTIQLAAIVICYRGNASSRSKTAQGCVGSRLDLQCSSTKIIRGISIYLGISGCGGIRCCIRDAGCSRRPSEEHKKYVNNSCDGQQMCTVEINSFDATPCNVGWWFSNLTIEPGHAFERITYNCAEDVWPTTADPFIHSSELDDGGDEERLMVVTTNVTAIPGIAIACVVCLVIGIAISVSVTVVIIRRKRRRRMKLSDAIKKSDLETDRKEAIYINDAVRTSLNENDGSSAPTCIYSNDNYAQDKKSLNIGSKNFGTPANDYCEVERVIRGRIQCDSEYEQLDHGKNHEPQPIYEQLQ